MNKIDEMNRSEIRIYLKGDPEGFLLLNNNSNNNLYYENKQLEWEEWCLDVARNENEVFTVIGYLGSLGVVKRTIKVRMESIGCIVLDNK